MKNSYWYLALGFVSLALFIYTLWKKRDSKLLVLYLFISGITFTFEFIILLFLKSYSYHPNILSNETYDSLVGSFFSNALAVPMAAVFIAAFKLNFYYILLFIAIFLGIEILFVNVDIYKHNWWKYYFTSVGLLINFYIAKKWYEYLHHNITNKIRAITIYFSSIVVIGTTGFFLTAVIDAFTFKLGIYENPFRDSFILFSSYMHFFALIIVIIIVKDFNWIYSLLIILMISVIDYILIANSIFFFNKGFSMAHVFFVRVVFVVFFWLIDRYLLRKS